MTEDLTYGKFPDYDKQLECVVQWATRFGVRMEAPGMAVYRKMLNALLNASKTKNEAQVTERFAEFVNTLYEAHELLKNYDGLQGAEPTAYVRIGIAPGYRFENGRTRGKAPRIRVFCVTE